MDEILVLKPKEIIYLLTVLESDLNNPQQIEEAWTEKEVRELYEKILVLTV